MSSASFMCPSGTAQFRERRHSREEHMVVFKTSHTHSPPSLRKSVQVVSYGVLLFVVSPIEYLLDTIELFVHAPKEEKGACWRAAKERRGGCFVSRPFPFCLSFLPVPVSSNMQGNAGIVITLIDNPHAMSQRASHAYKQASSERFLGFLSLFTR